MRNAGEQFLDDLSLATGGSACADPSMPRSVNGPSSGLPERQVQAMARINRARHLLGLHEQSVFWHVVFHNGSLAAFETAHRLRNGTATALLRGVLTALDEHYHRSPLRIAS
jgi:uncharacterized protein DUF6456